MQQQIYIQNAISLITKEVNRISPKSVLLVTGATSYTACGAQDFIQSLFNKSVMHRFCNFDTNPKIEDVRSGIEFCNKKNIDLIVAIGGGSAIDMAKLIRCYMHCNTELETTIITNHIPPPNSLPLMAIPTTAGTGSESTKFAVVYVDKVKYSVSHDSLLPNYAVIIPKFTYNSSKYLTAATGADALCQAIESYWSVLSTDESREYAKEAIIELWQHLPQALNNNLESRDQVAIAANLAGRAINISLTTAAHAYSYGFTTYLNIPHGHAVALTLPFFFNENLNVSTQNCNDTRGISFVKERMNELLSFIKSTPEKALLDLKQYFNTLFPDNENIISAIDKLTWKNIVSSVNMQRLQNNPIKNRFIFEISDLK